MLLGPPTKKGLMVGFNVFYRFENLGQVNIRNTMKKILYRIGEFFTILLIFGVFYLLMIIGNV